MTTKDQVNRIPVGLPADHPLSTAPRPKAAPRLRSVGVDEAEQQIIVWAYGRVSNDRGGRSKSVEEQNELLRRVCANNGWHLSREYNMSGARDGSASHRAKKRRLWWEQLIADILAAMDDPGAEMPDILAFDEVSRAERRSAQWLMFLDLIEPLGIKLYIHADEFLYDLSRHRHWEDLAEEGIKAESEARKTRRRVTRNLGKRLSSGKIFGRPGMGWLVERDRLGRVITKIDGNPVIYRDGREVVMIDGTPIPADEVKGRRITHFKDPGIAHVHVEVTKRVGARHPFSAIRDYLNENGILTRSDWARQQRGEKITKPATWTVAMVKAFVANPRNIGKVERGGVLVDAECEALVEEPDWFAAQVVLKEREAENEDHAKRSKPGNTLHLLRPQCSCGSERRMRGMAESRNTRRRGLRAPAKKNARYECRHSKGCGMTIDAKALEAYVVRTVAEFLGTPGIYSRIAKQDDRALITAQAERDAAQLELDALYKAVKNGEMTARMAAAEETRLMAIIADAEKRATALMIPAEVRKVIGMSEAAANVAGWFMDDNNPVAARRDALDRLVSITVARLPEGVPGNANPATIAARVTITPKCPSGCGTAMTTARGRWACPTCKPTKQEPQAPAQAA